MAGRTRAADAPIDASGLRVAIVVAAFNDTINDRLLSGAREWLTGSGVAEADLEVYWVPGAFELPLAAKTLAETGRIDAVVALGCVIRGETPHFDYVAGEAARGLLDASLDSGVPISFGVLTTDDEAQALDRAGGAHGNKGADAARAAVEMALLVRRVLG